MSQSIVLTGGTAMHPGLFDRFRAELRAALQLASTADKRRSTFETRFASISALQSRIAVLNDPSSGTAPGFAANLLPWIGASLAGAMKMTAIGETSREDWLESSSKPAVDWSRPAFEAQ